MRYRAYLHDGLIEPSESRRVTDRFDDAPNTWNFGVYVDGELCSSVRIHVLTLGMADVLHHRSVSRRPAAPPRPRRSSSSIRCRFVADPEKHQRFPELPYLTVRLAFVACDHFNADTRAGHRCVPSIRRSIVAYSCTRRFRRAPRVSGLAHQDGRADGVRFPEPAGKGPRRAFRSCAPALSSGACCSNAAARARRPRGRCRCHAADART